MSLLEHRRALKARKPEFLKQDTHKKPGILKKWARPRGIDSKMRLRLKGYRIMVTKGWKSPSEVRGLDRTGLVPKVGKNGKDVESMDIKKDGLIISSTVGMKKRIEMIRIAQKLGLKILNIKDPDGFISKAESGLASRKQEKEEKAKKKSAPKADGKADKKADKKVEKTDKSVEELAKEEEERQEQQKKEKDKILTKRE